MIFLPGLLSDERLWTAQVHALRGRAEVLVANLFDIDSIEEMAAATLRRADGPLAVVGHSMGGRVAVEMIRQAPERVAGLVLIDTALGPIRDGEAASRLEMVELANNQGMAALVDRWLPPMVHPDRAADAAWMERVKAMARTATPNQHERQVRAMLARPDALAVLPSVGCPTLILVGREDRWSPVEQHEETSRTIPGARLEVIEQCGHYAPVEQPDEVNRRLAIWLETQGFLRA